MATAAREPRQRLITHNRPDWEVNRCMVSYPELTMRIWARPDGIHINASIAKPGDSMKREWVSIAHVVFQPREVTEEKVIQWGIGALSTHLQRRAEASAEALADPS